MASRQSRRKILKKEEISELLDQSDLSDISDDGWPSDVDDNADSLSHSDDENKINEPTSSSESYNKQQYKGRQQKRKHLSIKSDEENRPVKHRSVVKQPTKEVRLDGVGHLPRFMEDKNASKCRLPGCNSRTRVVCIKCNMYLCVVRNNCFEKYHST
ncbi:unnamed protein product [Larinioides sclopetarius]|uniref:PiggyBac transposable element-derived protein 4 C-terminal zinc-ribbon domain-containing protein n=1 Tax=Larinioides sclopetarius TaxID=280406 RepID=A0AAV1Z7B3_9ARAC